MKKQHLAAVLEKAKLRDTSALIDFEDWPDFLNIVRENELVPRSIEGFTLQGGRQYWQEDVLFNLSDRDLTTGIDPFQYAVSFLEKIDLHDRDLKLLIIPSSR